MYNMYLIKILSKKLASFLLPIRSHFFINIVSAAVRGGSSGAIAPLDFRKDHFKPNKFAKF